MTRYDITLNVLILGCPALIECGVEVGGGDWLLLDAQLSELAPHDAPREIVRTVTGGTTVRCKWDEVGSAFRGFLALDRDEVSNRYAEQITVAVELAVIEAQEAAEEAADDDAWEAVQ
jgi:hypothetical protein